ncbi:hypothetical protein NPIL_36661 [Nephila pilipes]|uniref:Uncharacterized protein n=1 Tax=Nephila pilipes TaxID=299642 RepID=A0A8X6TAW6_NEPPI|nr:hypothetical protein NPIL_36661 [Nephila pilipes]
MSKLLEPGINNYREVKEVFPSLDIKFYKKVSKIRTSDVKIKGQCNFMDKQQKGLPRKRGIVTEVIYSKKLQLMKGGIALEIECLLANKTAKKRRNIRNLQVRHLMKLTPIVQMYHRMNSLRNVYSREDLKVT